MSNTLRIILNGRLLDEGEHSSLDDAEVTIRRKDDDGSLTYSYSGTITFYGQAYEEIFSELIVSPNARVNVITANVIDTCCNDRLLFRGKITFAQVDYCEVEEGVDQNCSINASLLEATEDAQAYSCLNRILISDNALGIQDRRHPFIRYCTEPSPIIAYVGLFILGNVLVSVMWLLFILLAPLIAVIQAVNTLPGVNLSVGGDPNIFRGIFDFIKDFSADLYGCGRGHPAPYIRDLVQNACDICGLDFQSSILNDPDSIYYNTMYVSAPNDEGSFDNDARARDKYWGLNGPITNSLAFLRELVPAWNADFSIINNTLIIERKDFFTTITPFLDFTQPENRSRIQDLCYEPTDSTLPNYARIQAQQDALDWVGNQALKPYYRKIVDYEPPVNANLNGERLYNLPFGSVRFRGDGVNPRPISDGILILLAFLFGGVPGGLTTLSVINDPRNKKAMLLQAGLCLTPKYVVRTDDGSDSIDAVQVLERGVQYTFLGSSLEIEGNPNYPFYVDRGQELWDRFFEWENPQNLDSNRNQTFSLTYQYDCDQLFENLADFLTSTVRLPFGGGTVTGRVESIIIRSDRTLTLEGTL